MDMVRDFSVTPFQSTLPTRGSDEYLWEHTSTRTYFNPRSPRGGATCAEAARTAGPSTISIHAPHEGERRGIRPRLSLLIRAISIHAPHEGGATMDRRGWHTDLLNFNPRSPRGGATLTPITVTLSPSYFNPRSPRGGATVKLTKKQKTCCISIHAPHEGERHVLELTHIDPQIISIHAPHEGERLQLDYARCRGVEFQSTLPTRGSDSGEVSGWI